MTKRILFIISLFTFTFYCASLRSQTTPATDTLPLAIEEEEMMEDENDSLTSFPSCGLYGNWDTSRIHYAKFDIATLKDSIKEVMLYDEASCGYVHPFSGQ